MDSLTQLALGAAVGEAVAGRRLGRRALLWGGLAGSLPDFDVLTSLVLDAPAALRWHRGPTHSLFFAFVAAPLLAGGVAALHRRFGWGGAHAADAGRLRPWLALFFWGLWTHPVLDAFTNYGTQLLWPLTNHPFALASVFIIDPAYTLPLLVAVVAAWRRRSGDDGARRAAAWALGLSTAYLGLGVAVQAHVRRLDDARGDAPPAARIVEPAGPSILLWTVLRRTASPFGSRGGTLTVGTYSLLDRPPYAALAPRPVAVAAPPVAPTGARPTGAAPLGSEAYRTLRWFSGPWLYERPDGTFCDARFGRTDGWADPAQDAPCVFTFRLVPAEGGYGWTFRQERPPLDAGTLLGRYARRAAGR